ncbi:MAG: winged helix-turn-helix transcriptional regulator [Thermoplasmatota archaeon]
MASRWLPPHPRRELILAVIEEQPGMSFRALERATGLKRGTLHYHLLALLRMGSIWTTRHGPCPAPLPRTKAVAGGGPRTPCRACLGRG